MGQGRRHLSVGYRIVRVPGRRHLLTCTALASGLALAAFLHVGPAQADDDEGGNGSGTGAAISSDSGFILNVPGDTSIGFINRSTNPATSGDAEPGEPGLATDGADGAAGSPGVPALPGVSAQGLGGMGGDAGLAQGGNTPIDVDVGGSIISATTFLLSGGDIGPGAGDATGGAGGAGGAGTGAEGGQGGAGGGGGGNITNSILPALAFVSGIPGAAGGAANAQGGNAGTGGQATGGSTGPIDIDVGVDVIGGLTITAIAGTGTGGEGRNGGAALGGTGGDGGDAGNQPFNNPGTVTTSAITGDLTFASGGAGGAGGSAHAIGGQGGHAGDGSGGALGSVTVDVGGNITGGFAFDGTGGAGTGRHGGDGGAATAGAGGDGGTGGGGGGTLTDTNVGGNVTFGSGGAGGAGGSADATGGDGGEGGDGTGGGMSAFSLIVGGDVGIPLGVAIDISAEGGVGTGGAGGAGGAATATSGGDGGTGGGGGGTATGETFGADILFGDGGAGGAGGSANATGGAGGAGGEGKGGALGALTLSVAGSIDHAVDIVLSGGEAKGGAGGSGGAATSGTGGAGGLGGIGASTVIIGSIEGSIVNGDGGPSGAGGSANATGGAGGKGGDALGGTLDVIDLDFTGASVTAVSLETLGGEATGGKGGDGGAAHAGKAGLGGPGAASGSANALGGAGGAGGNGLSGDLAGVTLSLGSNSTATADLTINVLGNEGKGGDGGKGGDATSADADPGQAAGDAVAGAGGAGGLGHGGAIGPVVVDAEGNVTDTLEVIARGGIGRGGTGGAGGAADAGNGGSAAANSGVAGGAGGDATGGTGGDGGDGTGGDVTVAVTTSGTVSDQGYVEIRAEGGDAFGGTGGAGGGALGGIGGAGGSGANGGTGQNGAPGGDGGDGGTQTGGQGEAGGDATGGTARVTVVNDGSFTSGVIIVTAKGGTATAGQGGAGGAAGDGASGNGGSGGQGGNGGDSANGGAGGNAGTGGDATAGDGGTGGAAKGGDAIVTITNNGTMAVSGENAIVVVAIGGGATAGNGGTGGFANAISTGTGGAGGNGMATGGVGGNGGNAPDQPLATGGDSAAGTAQGGNADVTVVNTGSITGAIFAINITTELGAVIGGEATPTGGKSTWDNQPGASGVGPGGDGAPGLPGDDRGGIVEGSKIEPEPVSGTSTIIVNNSGLADGLYYAARITALSNNTSVLIENSGTMTGGKAGIVVSAEGDDPASSHVRLVNSGVLSHGATKAIEVVGAGADILNTGTMWGSVNLVNDLSDSFDNRGVFEASFTSYFYGGEDVFTNKGGLVHTARNPLTQETVVFQQLETLNNFGGVISLVDGGADDSLTVGDGTHYNSQSGVLAVDAFLAPQADGGKADVFTINGQSTGVTQVVVNLTNPLGSTPNTDGIAIAQVTNGAQSGDFQVAGGVLNAGFFAWNIRLDEDDITHELYTSGYGAGSYEFAAGLTGLQDIWGQTVGSLLQRQADLRALIGATNVTPVADFAAPVEPTPVSHVTPGLWARAVGAHIERDADEANNVSTDREQDIWGIFAGFDFGTENVRSQGDALLFGLLAGYTTSSLDFDQTGDEWDFEGPSIGAYATYLDHRFFIDAVVKADFLSIDIDADALAPGDDDADTDAVNIGGQVDAGYKLLLEAGMFIEPQASLAVVHTEVDDVDIFGGSVDFDDETRASGRLGLRLGHEMTASGGTVYSGDVTASVWQIFTGDNDVTVEAPLSPAANISDDPGSTYGDVSVGFNVLAPDGWSAFARANWLFAEDYDAVTGNVGVRIAW